MGFAHSPTVQLGVRASSERREKSLTCVEQSLSSSWAAICPVIRQLTQVCSIRVHRKDLVLTIGAWPERHEKDLSSVCRP